MDDQTSKIVAQTIANLAEITARNTFGSVSAKIKQIKTQHDDKKTIGEMDQIISELLSDKNELERIAKTLENELVSQRISDDDIDFIVNSLVPLAREFAQNDEKQQQYLGYIEKVLSRESLKVMQLIGFNYREAIGRPLTNLCASAIQNLSKTTEGNELAAVNARNQTALAELSRDKTAYNRFLKLLGRNDLIEPDEPEKKDTEVDAS